MSEILESIIDMLHNAPEKRSELAYVIEQHREDSLIHLMSLDELKLLEMDIKRTLCKGLN
ncbi:hypothetical protein [Clostridium thailandense]|uniref:hypothetical protein n=1 Tax=Clostridium thailandense TaxID=2794346 RepID=UPI003989E83F